MAHLRTGSSFAPSFFPAAKLQDPKSGVAKRLHQICNGCTFGALILTAYGFCDARGRSPDRGILSESVLVWQA